MKKTALMYLAVAAVAAAYLYPFVRMFSDAPDYGVFLNGADLLNHGAIPSRDFVEPQGPGSFVWLAIFFRLFGTTLGTARGLLDATGVGMCLLAFYLSRRLGGMGIGAALFVLVISIPQMPINSPHYDSNLFAMGALALFLLAWEGQSDWWLVPAASLCGVVTWMIQQKGFYLMAAMMVSLVWAKRSRAAILVFAAYALVVSLPFAYFAAVHALPDVIYANYIWPMSKYSELNAAPYGFPVWGILRQASSVEDVLALVPFFFVAVLPVLLPFAAWSLKWRAFLPYWLCAFAIWLGELHRLDMGHLRNGVVLIAVMFFSICEAGESKLWRRIGLVSTLFVVLAGSTNLRAALDSEHSDVPGDASLVGFLQGHTKPGDEVFIYPYQPIYYFLEHLKNPTRYSYMQYHLHTDAQFLEATKDLERKRVRYVVFDSVLSGEHFQQVFPAYQQPERSKMIMELYLEKHYRTVKDLGRFRILERRSLN